MHLKSALVLWFCVVTAVLTFAPDLRGQLSGSGTPFSVEQVITKNNLTTTVAAPGWTVQNTTPATASVQTQNSPATCWIGQKWDTVSLVTRTSKVCAYLQAAAGTGNNGYLVFEIYDETTGAASQLLRLQINGNATLFGQLTASTLQTDLAITSGTNVRLGNASGDSEGSQGLLFGNGTNFNAQIIRPTGTSDVLAMQRTSNAQEWRVTGTTTGSKYFYMKHDGTNPILGSSSGQLKADSTLITPASTGTRYLCISTAGVIASSATACSGT